MYETPSKDGRTCDYCAHTVYRDYSTGEYRDRSTPEAQKDESPKGEDTRGRKKAQIADWHKVDSYGGPKSHRKSSSKRIAPKGLGVQQPAVADRERDVSTNVDLQKSEESCRSENLFRGRGNGTGYKGKS